MEEEPTGESPEASTAPVGDPEPAERDIDVRFSYANERTFLAWNRTSLAMITAGLAITQLLPPFEIPGGRKLIGLPLILLGVVLAFWSLHQWRTNEHAMRQRRPLPPSPLPKLVAVVVGLCALLAVILAAVSGQT